LANTQTNLIDTKYINFSSTIKEGYCQIQKKGYALLSDAQTDEEKAVKTEIC
jgi:hypothetical protein